jgi:hypothetical protein
LAVETARRRSASGQQCASRAAKARGVILAGRGANGPPTRRLSVLSLHVEELSYRLIARNVRLSKNTVMEIVRRQAEVA